MKVIKKLPPWDKQEQIYAISFKLIKAGELSKKLRYLLQEVKNNAENMSKMSQNNRFEQR